jgi:hypothetical protein
LSPKTLKLLQMYNWEYPVGLYHRLVRQLHHPQLQDLQSVVRSAQHITGDKLPALQDTYSTRCHRKAKKVIKDNNHPRPYLFTPLPSRRRGQYWCIKAGTKRQKLFFNLKATVKQSSLAQRGCCLHTDLKNHWPL